MMEKWVLTSKRQIDDRITSKAELEAKYAFDARIPIKHTIRHDKYLGVFIISSYRRVQEFAQTPFEQKIDKAWGCEQ